MCCVAGSWLYQEEIETTRNVSYLLLLAFSIVKLDSNLEMEENTKIGFIHLFVRSLKAL